MPLKYILGSFVVFALAVVYYKYDPEMYSFFPECPFHKYLGLDCPGCGSQRAVHALLHGNIMMALNYNALMVLSLPCLFIHLALKVAGLITGKNLAWNIWYKPATPWVVFILVMLFWIGRNIPVVPFTYLSA